MSNIINKTIDNFLLAKQLRIVVEDISAQSQQERIDGDLNLLVTTAPFWRATVISLKIRRTQATPLVRDSDAMRSYQISRLPLWSCLEMSRLLRDLWLSIVAHRLHSEASTL
jgi:hypothetical protein